MTLIHTNWHDMKSKVTDHFTVKEAVWLPSWGTYHVADDTERANLQRTCVLMERIRAFFGGRAVNVHCMIRPNHADLGVPLIRAPEGMTSEQAYALQLLDYNAFIGSVAKHSPHILGLACDFSIVGLSCDDVRRALLPKLEEWGFCMEDIPGANWVHVDLYEPIMHGHRRFFKP